MEASDSELLKQAQRGDDGAFGRLMERHAARLHALALGLVGPSDAEDLLQETLLAAFVGLRRYRGEASLRTWLSRIMLNQSSRHHRRMRLRKTVSLGNPGAGARSGGPGAGGADDDTPARLTVPSGIAGSDARLDLEQWLAELSDEHRQVLVLRELEGLSYGEMAQMLGLPRGTIESRLFRARQALRDAARGPTDEGPRITPGLAPE